MEHKPFDKMAFNTAFDIALAELQGAEKVTKKILSDLSRLLLEQVHADGDIQPCNRLLDVLTPMNRKTCVLFFQHFSGHHYSEKEEKFGKRDKGSYANKAKLSAEFLEDPHNNIWTWAMRHVQIEAKPFNMQKVTIFVSNALKKAEKEGFSQADVVKAILAGGLEVDALQAVLAEMAD